MCATTCVQQHVCNNMCATTCVQQHVCNNMGATTCVQHHACNIMCATTFVQHKNATQTTCATTSSSNIIHMRSNKDGNTTHKVTRQYTPSITPQEVHNPAHTPGRTPQAVHTPAHTPGSTHQAVHTPAHTPGSTHPSPHTRQYTPQPTHQAVHIPAHTPGSTHLSAVGQWPGVKAVAVARHLVVEVAVAPAVEQLVGRQVAEHAQQPACGEE